MFHLDNLVNNITGFFETKIELLKLDIQERISATLSGIVHLIVLVLVLFLVVLFAGIALGFGFGILLGSNALGFLLVSVLFMALLVLVNKKVIKGILDKEIQKSTDKLFKNNKEDGNE
jgi:uncharacterized membrane protein